MTDATLWACLIHDVTTEEAAQEPPMGLVSTRRWRDGFTALQAYRPRWHIEDDTCLAFNTAQVYRLQAGQHLASVGIRRLRRLRQRELGNAPAVIYLACCYGVFALEALLSLLGTPVRESLLPEGKSTSSPDAPT